MISRVWYLVLSGSFQIWGLGIDRLLRHGAENHVVDLVIPPQLNDVQPEHALHLVRQLRALVLRVSG